jgi:hypothetical protein
MSAASTSRPASPDDWETHGSRSNGGTRYADLFERMGGDVEGLLDPETAAEHNGQVTR